MANVVGTIIQGRLSALLGLLARTRIRITRSVCEKEVLRFFHRVDFPIWQPLKGPTYINFSEGLILLYFILALAAEELLYVSNWETIGSSIFVYIYSFASVALHFQPIDISTRS